MKEFFQHAATTDGMTVRVAVNYLPEQSHPEAGKWFWVYHIRIENGSDRTVQLLTRHWRITDGRGRTQQVQGDGVALAVAMVLVDQLFGSGAQPMGYHLIPTAVFTHPSIGTVGPPSAGWPPVMATASLYKIL